LSLNQTELPYRSVTLDSGSQFIEQLTCGISILDEWLTNHAVEAARARTATTFVWIDGSASVKAYYCLSAHALRRSETSSRIGRGILEIIPAALIGKLALHSDLQGRGLGRVLLADALGRVIRASRRGPAVRAIVVDAATPAGQRLYAATGFTQVPGHSTRMVVRASSIEASLAPNHRD